MIDHLSHSSVTLFNTCGMRWRYHYLDGLAGDQSDSLTIGSNVHKAIDAYFATKHLDDHAAGVKALRTMFHDLGKDASLEDPKVLTTWQDVLDSEDVPATLEKFTPLVVDNRLQVEVRCELEIEGAPPVVGYIDLIDNEGTIVDFKTAARKWNAQQHEEQVQLHYYYEASRLAGLPVNGRLVHVVMARTGGVQVFETEFNRRKFDFIKQVVGDVAYAIDHGAFTRNPSSCFAYGKKCPYWEQCRG